MNKPEEVLALRKEQARNRVGAEQMAGLELIFNSTNRSMDNVLETLNRLADVYLSTVGEDQEAKLALTEKSRLRLELDLALASYRRWILETRQKKERMHYTYEKEAKTRADFLEAEFNPEEKSHYRKLRSENNPAL